MDWWRRFGEGIGGAASGEAVQRGATAPPCSGVRLRQRVHAPSPPSLVGLRSLVSFRQERVLWGGEAKKATRLHARALERSPLPSQLPRSQPRLLPGNTRLGSIELAGHSARRTLAPRHDALCRARRARCAHRAPQITRPKSRAEYAPRTPRTRRARAVHAARVERLAPPARARHAPRHARHARYATAAATRASA